MKLLVLGDFYSSHRLQDAILAKQEVLGKGLKALIDRTDFQVLNLEAPVTLSNKAINKTGPAIKMTPESVQFLLESGLNTYTLANNHIMDYGPKGLSDTMDVLKKEKANAFGAGNNFSEASRPLFLEKDNLNVVLVNFAENEWSTTMGELPGANPVDPVRNFEQIQRLKQRADKLIVIHHGGHEHHSLPSPRLKELLRFYVDCGADAVINHHTHCISGFEHYKGAPIYYSIGNFLFDHPQRRDEEWNFGMALELNIQKDLPIEAAHHHFEQCNAKAGVECCEGDQLTKREARLEELNRILASQPELETAFNAYMASMRKSYRNYIEPHNKPWLSILQNRLGFPSLWSRRKLTYLTNVVRCESHREVLLNLLEDHVGNTQQ